MNGRRRVVVTGVGAVTPLGNDAETFWENLTAGKSGAAAIQQFDLVTVKDMMGHSKLTTTERYLHSKPRPDDVMKLTRIFG